MMSMKLSQRAQKLEPSVTLAAAAKAKALKAKGVDVLSLTVGEPDFTTPKILKMRQSQRLIPVKLAFTRNLLVFQNYVWLLQTIWKSITTASMQLKK